MKFAINTCTLQSNNSEFLTVDSVRDGIICLAAESGLSENWDVKVFGFQKGS